jgi:hypothetical protein
MNEIAATADIRYMRDSMANVIMERIDDDYHIVVQL